ncbi:MAG: GDP-mannose 4,6-dehydratase [Planctomycetota bacterium]
MVDETASNPQRATVVLGANSFSGQDFVDLLITTTNDRVFGISRSQQRDATFSSYLRHDPDVLAQRFEYHALDMNHDMPAILALLDRWRPQRIINFAAQSEVAPSWDHPEHWYQTNTVALSQLVNHLRDCDYLQRYVHISSPEVYGSCVGEVLEDAPANPSTPYAASKAAADMLLAVFRKQYDFPLLTIRATNVYGARQQLFKIIPRTVIYRRLGRKIPLHGGGHAVKSYIHIRDVSRGELAVLDHGTVGETYHISPDQGVAVRDVVGTICSTLGETLADATTRVGERPGQDAAYVIDSTKIREELGWQPTIPLATGISEVVAWIDERWRSISELPHEYLHVP